LPEDHPDRRLLEGLQQTVEAFTQRGAAATPPAGAPESAGDAPRAEAPGTAPTPEDLATSEQVRVRLHGRCAYPPTYRTTPKGVLVGTFPLAVRDDANPDQTTFWKVYAFRQRAETLRAQQLSKGQVAEVIGYGYDHTLTKRDGSTSIEHRVNAVAIKVR
jgi:hypothetical protein